MLGSERKGIATALGAAVVEVSSVVEDIHLTITHRAFATVGLSRTRPEQAQRMHASTIYRTIRTTARVASFVAGEALERSASAQTRSIGDSPRGAVAVASISCAFGDSLEAAGNALAPQMSVRIAGAAVPLDSESLRLGFPDARGHVVVFLHGLGGTELAWQPPADPTDGNCRPSFGDTLSADLDVTPVHIRYNAGVHICENGEDLNWLLADLVAHWPSAVTSLTLVGHSMGGLVIRSACQLGAEREVPWLSLVKNVVYLGSPHWGAPLERVSDFAISRLDQFEATKSLVRLANRRSSGIKDLRHGTIAAADRAHGDPNRRLVQDHQDHPLLETAGHHFIASQVLSPRWGRAAAAVGDLMVPSASATGSRMSGHRQPLTTAQIYRLRGTSHIGLLTDPQIYPILRDIVSDSTD